MSIKFVPVDVGGKTFMVGAGMPHRVLAETAGLPLTKDIDTWFS